jgi:hypothetical protein
MVGFTAPNRYQPRAGWRARLDSWVQFPVGAAGSWQADIGIYWRRTTREGKSLDEAWTGLNMSANNATTSLNPNSTDTGMIPPELFSRVLARSQGGAGPVADVVLEPDPTPPPVQEDGFHEPNRYKPSAGWKGKLDTWLQFPPAGAWQRDISLYWRKIVEEGKLSSVAWTELEMAVNNASTALNRNSLDRGVIPSDLIGRVVARARGSANPADEADVILDPDPTPPPVQEDGFFQPNRYRPKAGWREKLNGWLQFPPAGAWQRDVSLYWRKIVQQGKSPPVAWAELQMAVNNASTALDRTSVDRGVIPPELIGRLVARARGSGNPNDVADVVIDPERT